MEKIFQICQRVSNNIDEFLPCFFSEKEIENFREPLPIVVIPDISEMFRCELCQNF